MCARQQANLAGDGANLFQAASIRSQAAIQDVIAHVGLEFLLVKGNDVLQAIRIFRAERGDEFILHDIEGCGAGCFAVNNPDKAARSAALNIVQDELITTLGAEYPDRLKDIIAFYEKELKAYVRNNILDRSLRPDGRGLKEIRPITCEVGLLPRTHGSALFTRGQTQVLSVVTLGSPGDEQVLDGLGLSESKRFMHHYNFPPFSTGETRPLRGPGRREIGHGALAERAVAAVIPTQEEFPYTIRAVSDVLSSNGSTSMGSVCGTTLALMDAGVPIHAPVAGVAMGLVTGEGERAGKWAVLTDIQGIEDALGDMDFKVAG